MNLYGYAGGDPINFSDPFGLCKREGTRDQSIRALGRELNPRGCVLSNARVQSAVAELYVRLADRVGADRITMFEVSGGDRYVDKKGQHRSASDDEIIPGSASGSLHLRTNGGSAVDLQIRGVDNETVREVAAEVGLDGMIGPYEKDGHRHFKKSETPKLTSKEQD